MNSKTFSEKWDKEEKINENRNLSMAEPFGFLTGNSIYKKWWFWALILVVLYFIYKIYN